MLAFIFSLSRYNFSFLTILSEHKTDAHQTLSVRFCSMPESSLCLVIIDIKMLKWFLPLKNITFTFLGADSHGAESYKFSERKVCDLVLNNFPSHPLSMHIFASMFRNYSLMIRVVIPFSDFKNIKLAFWIIWCTLVGSTWITNGPVSNTFPPFMRGWGMTWRGRK